MPYQPTGSLHLKHAADPWEGARHVPVVACLGVFVLLAVVAAAAGGVTYNRLATLQRRVDTAWEQVVVQLERRHELAAPLAERVASGGGPEMVRDVRRAVSAAGAAVSVRERSAAEDALSGVLAGLRTAQWTRPDLGSDAEALRLVAELGGTEGKIAYARQFYNDTAMTYNTEAQTFPYSLLAGPVGMRERDYFEIELDATSTGDVPLGGR